MTDTLKPRDAKDVEEAVGAALAHGNALEVIGHGSKRTIGRPAQTVATLDLSVLTGVTLYEPEELVLSAKAGTPLAEIEALVELHGQELAFDPMDCAPLLGEPTGRGTIGGMLAVNFGGSRRIKAGAPRDHFLGVSAVSGRGETFKSGGRVVKNVTGYDLCKLLAGSWGTLGVITDVTIKTLPRAETETTVVARGLDAARAIELMGQAMGSSCDVSGAAHLPAASARLAGSGDSAVTALRVEGFAPSVVHRQQALAALAKAYGSVDLLDAAASRALWRSIRDVTPFAAQADETGSVWRISTAPARGAELGHMITVQGEAELIYDWAGGLIWATLLPSDDAGAAMVRRAVRSCGGHATLIRAPAAVRAAVEVFEPQEPGVAALARRVKASFDPKGVLNPGRMYAGV